MKSNNLKLLLILNLFTILTFISTNPISAGDVFIPETCSTYGSSSTYPGLPTGIGCLPTYPTSFIEKLVSILFGIGGGIAFILMIIGTFFIITSRGQPEQIKQGKDTFIGGLIGLLFMIASVWILTVIGVDFLGLFEAWS